MNTGKTLFAQLMDFLPWTTFTRIATGMAAITGSGRFPAPSNTVHGLRPADLPGKPRDIETCLSVHASRASASRSGARRWPANERRDWRIHAALAQRLITQARTLYGRRTGVGPDQYRLRDSTTIALCLSVFPWAHFRTTKAAVKMHTLLDLRGNIRVLSTSRMASCTTFMPSICSCRKPEPSTASWIVAVEPAFMCCTKPGPSSSRVPSRAHRCSSRLFGAGGSLDRHHLRPDHLPGRLLHPSGLPRTSRRIRFKKTPSGKTLVFITNNALPAATICALYKSRWQVELFFKWIKQHLRISSSTARRRRSAGARRARSTL